MAQVEQWMKDAAKAILYAGSWPDEWEQSDADEITDIIAAHAPSVAPPPRGEKRPIARPCSACGDGDTEMKYHDHFPPFADESGAPSVAETSAPMKRMMVCYPGLPGDEPHEESPDCRAQGCIPLEKLKARSSPPVCPLCDGPTVSTAHGFYCPKKTCKWGWKVEMDGSR